MIPKGKDVNDLSEEDFNSLPIVDEFEWMEKYSK